MEKPILAAILSIKSTTLNDVEKKILAQANPLGINLFTRNIESKIQLKKLIKDFKEVIGREDVIIAVDQEGGRVRRLREPEFRPYAAQIDLGKLADKFGEEIAKKTISNHAKLIAHDLYELGINLNYAPVLDLAFPETAAVLKSRCLSDDEHKVAQYGKIMVDEYTRNNICPCIKHLPGHGRVVVDPHLNLPVLGYDLKELSKDFYPFQELRHTAAGMTAHIVISAVDEQFPITQSRRGIDTIIRGIIGFDGLLISDAIDMKALKGNVTEKAQKALEAGCDVVCYTSGIEEELQSLADNCSFLTDKAMIRFAKIKNIIHNNHLEGENELASLEYQDIIGKIESYKDEYDATEILHKMKTL